MRVRPEGRITVIHADPWKMFREGVKRVLGEFEEMEVVGEAENGRELMSLLEEREPDVILLEISLRLSPGEEIIPLLREKFPGVKIIVLTMVRETSVIIRALGQGADGYLTVDADGKDIHEAIHASFGPGSYLNVGVRSLSVRNFEYLSAREIKFIRVLGESADTKEVARKLGMSTMVVEAILERLKKIARVATNSELIAMASEKGFLDL